MVSMSVFLSRDRLPAAHEWQRALDDAGLPLQLDTGVNLNDFIGFLPVSYRGQSSGFEYFVEHDVTYPDAAPLFSSDTLDTCVTLVSRSRLESLTTIAAAAALGALTEGVVYDDAEGRGYAASDAIAWARRIVTEDDAS